jgi:hypothetical protein
MKEFLRKWLFGKTDQLLKLKEIDLQFSKEKLNNFDLELKVKSESLLLKEAYLIEQKEYIDKRLEKLKTIRSNLKSYELQVEEKKVTYNEIKERNEFVENLQVVKSRNKEMLIDKYGNFKGYK